MEGILTQHFMRRNHRTLRSSRPRAEIDQGKGWGERRFERVRWGYDYPLEN